VLSEPVLLVQHLNKNTHIFLWSFYT